MFWLLRFDIVWWFISARGEYSDFILTTAWIITRCMLLKSWRQLLWLSVNILHLQVNSRFSLVDTIQYSSLIGWHNAKLIFDWLFQLLPRESILDHLWLMLGLIVLFINTVMHHQLHQWLAETWDHPDSRGEWGQSTDQCLRLPLPLYKLSLTWASTGELLNMLSRLWVVKVM